MQDYWYKKSGQDLASAVFTHIKLLDTHQSYRQAENIKNMRLYGNFEFNGPSGFSNSSFDTGYSTQNRVTLNIVQSMVDTVVSKIGKNRPKPYFLTSDGDFTLQRKAKKLTKFIEGQFYATKFYEKAQIAFKDACIFGTGALKIFVQDDEIKVERVFIDEIVIDDVEAYYGEPRQMHQKKWVHKDVLKAAFPSYAGDIDAAVSDSPLMEDSRNRKGDMLLVVESWKLRSGIDKKDGKHTICIGNCDFVNEQYDKDYFPFVFFRWNMKPLGFFGQGIAEQLTGIQLEINKLLKTIQVSMHLVSVPKILVDMASTINVDHLNNKIGGIIKYAGTKPEFAPLGSIPAELFSQLDRLYSRAFEIIGVSQLSAQSTKPAGLDSGKALRVYNDLESERFQDVEKRHEQVFLDATNIFIDLIKEIAERTENFSVRVPGKSFLETINWADVVIEEDQYLMKCYPISALSNTPADRLKEVQELMQAGFISKEDGMQLLEFPDLEGTYSMVNAGVEDIHRQIELMVDKQEYQSPEPYQNLDYGIKKMQEAYLKYRQQNAPEEILELFRQWMSDAKNLLSKAAVDVQAQQQGAQMQAAADVQTQQAIANPQAPPTSELLPFS